MIKYGYGSHSKVKPQYNKPAVAGNFRTKTNKERDDGAINKSMS